VTGARNRSPELDPVVLLCTILTIALLALAGWKLASQAPSIQCPAPDHPVWASSLHQWLCGDSLTIGGKSR
jgi:TRAP-type C4-dicarboxylate transport system permease small subunit